MNGPALVPRRPGYVHFLLFIAANIGMTIPLMVVVVGMKAAGASAWQTQLVIDMLAVGLYAMLNPLVGYRWHDAFLLLLPFVSLPYSVKIIWRATSLPFAYWVDGVASQETLRRGIYRDALKMGAQKADAELAAMALVPFDDRRVPSAQFVTVLRTQISQCEAAIRSITDNSQIGDVVTAALQGYASLAMEHGEGFYVQRFNNLLVKHNRPPAATQAMQRFSGMGHDNPTGQRVAPLPSWFQNQD